MRENWEIIKMYFERYRGESLYFVLFAVCLAYIFIRCRDKRKILVYPSLLLTILIINPWLYQKIWTKLMTITYWRMFWMLPMLPVIAYAAADVLKRIKKTTLRLIVLAAVFFVIAVKGQYMYSDGVFSKASNPYKIPQEAEAVAVALLEMDDEPRAVVPDSLYSNLRQYSTKIKLMFGRNADGYLDYAGMNKEFFDVWWYLKQDEPNWGQVARISRENDFPYIVTSSGQDEQNQMQKYGYEFQKEVSGYDLYQDVWEPDKQMTWEVEKHINPDYNDAFITIKDEYDRILLIDGGFVSNEEFVRNIVKKMGNTVEEWMVTDLAEKNAGAYFMISNHLQEVRYNKAYWPDIIDNNYPELLEQSKEPPLHWEEAVYDCYNRYKEVGYPVDVLEKGENAKVLGLDVRVLNAFESNEGNISDLLRENSLVIQIEGKDERILYIPDITADRLDGLFRQYGDQLESDYLVWNCRETDKLNELKKVVKPKKVIFLKDKEPFSVRID